ncbi:MAG: hypothetical protein ABFR95_02510, partial [Actinomycetota bacterium]
MSDYDSSVRNTGPVDRDLDRLLGGSRELSGDLAPFTDFVAALRTQASAPIAQQKVAALARPAAVVATNKAQELLAAQNLASNQPTQARRSTMVGSLRHRVATVAATAAMFIGSLSGVAVAANNAKPGDLLYGI